MSFFELILGVNYVDVDHGIYVFLDKVFMFKIFFLGIENCIVTHV